MLPPNLERPAPTLVSRFSGSTLFAFQAAEQKKVKSVSYFVPYAFRANECSQTIRSKLPIKKSATENPGGYFSVGSLCRSYLWRYCVPPGGVVNL